jgi:hypothetical protein
MLLVTHEQSRPAADHIVTLDRGPIRSVTQHVIRR